MNTFCAVITAWLNFYRGIGSIVVSISFRHLGVQGSISGHGRHGIFDVKTWLSTLGTVYPLAVTALAVTIDHLQRLAWCKYYDTD